MFGRWLVAVPPKNPELFKRSREAAVWRERAIGDELTANARAHPRVDAIVDPKRRYSYTVAAEGRTVDLEECTELPRDLGDASLTWPEWLKVVPDLPRTAIEKVSKALLREDIAEKLRNQKGRSHAHR